MFHYSSARLLIFYSSSIYFAVPAKEEKLEGKFNFPISIKVCLVNYIYSSMNFILLYFEIKFHFQAWI